MPCASVRRAPPEQGVHLGVRLFGAAGRRRHALGHGEPQSRARGEGDEPLLRAVVQIALEAAALTVGGLEPTMRAREGTEVLELGAQLGVEALVVERETGRPETTASGTGRVGDEARAVREGRREFGRREKSGVSSLSGGGAVGAVRPRRRGGRRAAGGGISSEGSPRRRARAACRPPGAGEAAELDHECRQRRPGAAAARPLAGRRASARSVRGPLPWTSHRRRPSDVVAQESAVERRAANCAATSRAR